jgi:Protein of unknown function (DUF3150)
MSANGFDEMVAIQLAVRSWPGQVKLKAEDLGLDEADVPEIFRLGNKRLYPDEWRQRFNHIANQARYYLYDVSYPFVVEAVRAIPKRNLARLVERLEDLKAEYLAKSEEFLARYWNIQAEWREKYPDIWPRLAFHYPSADRLRRRFDFYWNVFEIKGATPVAGSAPEVMEAYDRAKAELQVRYDEMVDEAVIYLRKKVLEVVTNLSSRLKERRIVRNDTLDSVRRVDAWFKDLNIFGDDQVEETLGKLRAALNGTDHETLKDNAALQWQLADLADQVAAVAGKLDDVSTVSGNYKRLIDLS